MPALKPAWLSALVISVMAVGGAWVVLRPRPLVAQSEPAPLAAINRIGALGRLQPNGRVITVGGPSGERVGELLIQEGDRVRTGDIIARLDNYAERRAERNFAASQLVEAQAQLASTTTVRRLEVEEARTRLQQVDQPRQQEIAAQQAQIRQLEAELSDAQTNLQRFQDLHQEGAVSQLDLDQRRLRVQQAQESLNSAQSTLDRIEATRLTDINTIQTQLQVSQAALQALPSQTPIQSLTRNLELAEARLQRAVIRAPLDGQILRIRRFPGEVIDHEGIVQLGDTNRMYVVAEIYETDVPKVQVGQSVQIRGAAFPETLQGEVDFIGLQIGRKEVLSTNPAEDVDARVVEVKVRIAPEDNDLAARLTNMQVTVTIDLQG